MTLQEVANNADKLRGQQYNPTQILEQLGTIDSDTKRRIDLSRKGGQSDSNIVNFLRTYGRDYSNTVETNNFEKELSEPKDQKKLGFWGRLKVGIGNQEGIKQYLEKKGFNDVSFDGDKPYYLDDNGSRQPINPKGLDWGDVGGVILSATKFGGMLFGGAVGTAAGGGSIAGAGVGRGTSELLLQSLGNVFQMRKTAKGTIAAVTPKKVIKEGATGATTEIMALGLTKMVKFIGRGLFGVSKEAVGVAWKDSKLVKGIMASEKIRPGVTVPPGGGKALAKATGKITKGVKGLQKKISTVYDDSINQLAKLNYKKFVKTDRLKKALLQGADKESDGLTEWGFKTGKKFSMEKAALTKSQKKVVKSFYDDLVNLSRKDLPRVNAIKKTLGKRMASATDGEYKSVLRSMNENTKAVLAETYPGYTKINTDYHLMKEFLNNFSDKYSLSKAKNIFKATNRETLDNLIKLEKKTGVNILNDLSSYIYGLEFIKSAGIFAPYLEKKAVGQVALGASIGGAVGGIPGALALGGAASLLKPSMLEKMITGVASSTPLKLIFGAGSKGLSKLSAVVPAKITIDTLDMTLGEFINSLKEEEQFKQQ